MKSSVNISPSALHMNEDTINREIAAMDYANGISHELRTPLNVIIGMCQFLERDRKTPLSPLHRDAVTRMERNARALLESVNHLLEHLRKNQTH